MAKLRFNGPIAGLFGGMMWLGSAQVIGRCVRLLGSILLARMLTPEIFGQAAIILTAFELIATLIRRISSARLIAMDDPELVRHLAAAGKLNWLACFFAFVAMSLLSAPLSMHFNDLSLIGPMILMATSYLLMPFGMLHCALNQRENRMRVLGSAVLWQIIADGLMTIMFALLGLGLWAIILPKVVSTLVWVAIHRQQADLPCDALNTHRENPRPHAGISSLWSSGLQTGLCDFISALRVSVDILLVGAFLGLPALGVYFFASSAALGITLALVQSFGTAFYSRLCSKKPSQQVGFVGGLLTVSLITSPLIALQCLLAPWYVPLLYGSHWVDAGAIPIFIMLCLSGLCRPLGEAASQLLISRGLTGTNLALNMAFSALLAAAIMIAVQISLSAVATAVMVVYGVGMPLMAMIASRLVKRAERNATSNSTSNATSNSTSHAQGHTVAVCASTAKFPPSTIPFKGDAS